VPILGRKICVVEPDERYQSLEEMLEYTDDVDTAQPSAAVLGTGMHNVRVKVPEELKLSGKNVSSHESAPPMFRLSPESELEAADHDFEAFPSRGVNARRRLQYAAGVVASGLWVALGVYLFNLRPDWRPEVTEADSDWEAPVEQDHDEQPAKPVHALPQKPPMAAPRDIAAPAVPLPAPQSTETAAVPTVVMSSSGRRRPQRSARPADARARAAPPVDRPVSWLDSTPLWQNKGVAVSRSSSAAPPAAHAKPAAAPRATPNDANSPGTNVLDTMRLE
jgi:hypothetical protein